MGEGVGASEQLGPGQRVLQKLTGVGLPENYRESIAIGGLIIQTMLKTHHNLKYRLCFSPFFKGVVFSSSFLCQELTWLTHASIFGAY